jgi:methyl-accepting chemotaxis protein
MFVVLLTVSVIAVGSVNLSAFFVTLGIVRERINTEIEQISIIERDRLQTWLDSQASQVEVIAQNSAVIAMDAPSATQSLAGYKSIWTDFENFFLIDPTGQAIASTSGSLNNYAEREYFQKAIQGEAFISQPLVSKTTGNIVVVFAVPVKRDGQVVGVVSATIPTESILSKLALSNLSEEREVIITDESGLLLTPSRYEEQLKAQGKVKQQAALEMIVNSAPIRQALEGKIGTADYVNYAGIAVVGTSQVVERMRWVVTVEMPQKVVYAPLWRLAYLILTLLIVSVIVVSILAQGLTTYFFGPIQLITRLADSIAEGDVHQQINTNTWGDVGLLALAFERMTNSLRRIDMVVSEVASGDLTVDFEPRSTRDVLGVSISSMINSLRDLVRGLSRQAYDLRDASNRLAFSSSQAKDATLQISTTIHSVAARTETQASSTATTASSVESMARAIDGIVRGAQEQSKAVSEVSKISTQIGAAIEQVAGSAGTVMHEAEKAAQSVREGVEVVEKTIQGMERIRQAVGVSADKVNEMGERSKQISAIVETIEEIASQTNLLALNAAIEAARAGNSGLGFAVVAEEVRHLAEKSAEATRQIATLVRGIQVAVDNVVKAMESGEEEVNHGVALTNSAGSVLEHVRTVVERVTEEANLAAQAAARMNTSANQLASATDTVSSVVEENTAITKEMSVNSNSVLESISDISNGARENSAAIEQVNASSMDMAAQIQSTAHSAQELAKMAAALEDMVSQFRVK